MNNKYSQYLFISPLSIQEDLKPEVMEKLGALWQKHHDLSLRDPTYNGNHKRYENLARRVMKVMKLLEIRLNHIKIR